MDRRFPFIEHEGEVGLWARQTRISIDERIKTRISRYERVKTRMSIDGRVNTRMSR